MPGKKLPGSSWRSIAIDQFRGAKRIGSPRATTFFLCGFALVLIIFGNELFLAFQEFCPCKVSNREWVIIFVMGTTGRVHEARGSEISHLWAVDPRDN